jgi:glycosyltransferase involved in cell wall biosynthesis
MISVIICTFNRANSLQQTLQSLQEMPSLDFPWEVLVVDNNSSDHTQQVVEACIRDFGLPLTYVFETQQGLSAARNTGIREARGEIIAFTDDDVSVESQWLKAIQEFYQHHNADAMGGRVLPLFPPGTPSWVRQNSDLFYGPFAIYDYGEQICPIKEDIHYIIGANMAFRTSCFTTSGLFRTDLGRGTALGGEDEEFVRRLIRDNRRIYYNGTSCVYHHIAKTRITYRYWASWYFAAGRFMLREQDVTIDNEHKQYWGMPAEFVKAGIHHALLFLRYVHHRREALKHWEMIFRFLGMGYEYTQMAKH